MIPNNGRTEAQSWLKAVRAVNAIIIFELESHFK